MKPNDTNAKSSTPAAPAALAGVWTPEQRMRSVQVLEEELASLIRQLAEAQCGQREKDETNNNKQRGLLLELLEVSDAFERVFARVEKQKAAYPPEITGWVSNFRMIYRLLWRTLRAQGVARIENLDGIYDPHWHLPQTRIFDLAQPEGTIIREEKPGYIWSGILLRKAEVAVTTHHQDEAVAPEESRASENQTNP